MTRRSAAALLVLLLAHGAGAQPRLYDVTTETGMPHLDESLRYATRREARCLDPAELSGAFWMLQHVALQDCRLVKASAERYPLQCDGGHGTQGEARWQLDDPVLRGTLEVRLGGKNMTFHQRIVARPLGACP